MFSFTVSTKVVSMEFIEVSREWFVADTYIKYGTSDS